MDCCTGAICFFFFFNDTATTEIYTLSLHDALPILLTPQMPVGAWSKEPGPEEGPREIGGRPTPTMFDRLPFTYPFNLTGQPAATVPCGFTSEGLPVGLQRSEERRVGKEGRSRWSP